MDIYHILNSHIRQKEAYLYVFCFPGTQLKIIKLYFLVGYQTQAQKNLCPNLSISQTLKKSQNYLCKKQEKLKNSTRTKKKCPDKEKSKRNWDDSTIFYLYVNSCFSNLDSRVFLRILILLYLNITATSVYRLFFPVVNKWIAAQLPTSDSSI